MSLLTTEELLSMDYRGTTDEALRYARAIEAAVIKKLHEQKPAAWVSVNENGECVQTDDDESPFPGDEGFKPLYLHPQLRCEWQPIETAPKDGRRVLVFSEKRGVREARFYNENSDGTVWYDTMVGGGPMTVFYDVTHWQPLPKPPEAK